LLDDILDLGLTYRLVTRRTSLFAPDENIIVNPDLTDIVGEEDRFAATAVEEHLAISSWLGKDFYLRDQTWVDMDYRDHMLLEDYDPQTGQPPRLDDYARLGENIIVVLRQTAYVLKGNALPTQPVLQQNFPNPFNSGTLIRYILPTEGRVKLAIYNLAGQQVVTIEEGFRSAGAYAVAWDGKDDQGRTVVSGMYLYRLEAGSLVQTRKLMLLK